MNKILENSTKIAFISLATLPLLKANYNSMLIILCALLTILYFFKNKIKQKFEFKSLVYSLPFFLYLFYELFSKSYNLSIILLNLPFLIFPLLFLYKPKFINNEIKERSFVVFQLSVVIQTILFLITFLRMNNLNKLFAISKENIPFFREYVTNNYLFEIHPTYFSSYLLLGITISLFKFNKSKILHSLNTLFSIFFLFLFSSRIIILLLFVTIFAFLAHYLFLKRTKKKYIILAGLLSVLLFTIVLNTDFVSKRFKEIKTEINKPIIGKYYNSTNTRIAIYKCDIFLAKNLPFWGYGMQLQQKLNQCFAENNNSDFYKISVFNTHNYYFHLMLYGGILFLLLFLLYVYFVFKNIKYNVLGVFLFFQKERINARVR
jgi:O-antigen ligase